MGKELSAVFFLDFYFVRVASIIVHLGDLEKSI